jgi:hypothetical protein
MDAQGLHNTATGRRVGAHVVLQPFNKCAGGLVINVSLDIHVQLRMNALRAMFEPGAATYVQALVRCSLGHLRYGVDREDLRVLACSFGVWNRRRWTESWLLRAFPFDIYQCGSKRRKHSHAVL